MHVVMILIEKIYLLRMLTKYGNYRQANNLLPIIMKKI